MQRIQLDSDLFSEVFTGRTSGGQGPKHHRTGGLGGCGCDRFLGFSKLLRKERRCPVRPLPAAA